MRPHRRQYEPLRLSWQQRQGCLAQVVEQKGLDIVRRDWCPLSKDVGNFVLGRILSGQPQEEVVDAIHLHLQEVLPCMLQGLGGSCSSTILGPPRPWLLSVEWCCVGFVSPCCPTAAASWLCTECSGRWQHNQQPLL